MQKWYDEGYFTPDLLMKRTHLDTDWTPVGELSVRAGKEKLFFSSFLEAAPPGLSPRPSLPPMDGLTFDRSGQPLGQISHQTHHPPEPYSNGSPLNHFRHPVATRPSALDSFLASSSNSSHSPASSFGVPGLAPASDSPDLPFGATGGRTSFGNNVAEPSFTGRVGGYEQQSPSIPVRSGNTGFGANNDSLYGPRLGSLTQRGPMFEAQGLNNLAGPVASPWTAGNGGNLSRNHDSEVLGNMPIHRTPLGNGMFSISPVTNVPGFNELGQEPTQFVSGTYTAGFSQPGRGERSTESISSSFGLVGLGGLREQGSRPPQDSESVPINIQHGTGERSMTSSFGPSSTSAVHGQGSVFGVHGNQQTLPQHLPPQRLQQPPQNLPPTTTFNQFPPAPSPSSPSNVIQTPQLQQPTAPSSWGLPQALSQPHPHLVDSPQLPSNNAMQTLVNASEISSYQSESAELYSTSKLESADTMGDMSNAQPSSANHGVEGHKAKQSPWNASTTASSATVDRSAAPGLTARLPVSAPHAPPQASPNEPAPQASAKKRVSPPQTSQAAAPKSTVAAPTPSSASVPKPPSPHPTTSTTQAKPAWSTPVIGTDDEAKPTKHAGLREIQEAEAKRAEARKLAEREKERAARARIAHPPEDTQAFTASWGLPISQAGTARSIAKEQVAASPSITPVWTNAAKPQQIKRTMKEIQEEEERRKKASSKETAATAARRAQGDSATKV